MLAKISNSSILAAKNELSLLQQSARKLETEWETTIEAVPESVRDSARNLVHYLAIRQVDIRPLQLKLHALGLSSLGRMEPYVIPTLTAVQRMLAALTGDEFDKGPHTGPDPAAAQARLNQRTSELLGASRNQTRIMVTLPNKNADHPKLLHDLLEAGMDVMRLNCAKGSPKSWSELLDRLRKAEKETGRECRVQLDIEGPNPRTMGMSKKLALKPDDLIKLTGEKPGERKQRKANRKFKAIVRINLSTVLAGAKTGDDVVFDDGKIAGEIESTDESGVSVRIKRANKGMAKLGNGKGINFPNTSLEMPSITKKDLRDLDFIAENADLVGLSFVRKAKDVERIQSELKKRNARAGLVLKIETKEAFEELPQLLLAALKSPPVGVMIARGDMGAELGFERMAEVQEQILWLCDAAHVPVIWATQVLESLSKKGVPSRGETTDAALAVRSDCVMLNKGKYVVDTVRFLSRLLDRMSEHQRKKWSLLQKLNAANPNPE